MSEFFKSKAGMLLAGIYLSIVLSCVLYIYLIDANSPPLILLMILIAPWFYLFAYFLNEPLGINFMHEVAGSKNVDYRTIVDNVEMALSVLINAFILYLLGFLLAKAFTTKPKP